MYVCMCVCVCIYIAQYPINLLLLLLLLLLQLLLLFHNLRPKHHSPESLKYFEELGLLLHNLN